MMFSVKVVYGFFKFLYVGDGGGDLIYIQRTKISQISRIGKNQLKRFLFIVVNSIKTFFP